ncbi:MAG: riboflavin synthase [Bacteroidota bacterium]|nr:riboflavin synthase [Bacteroidota bacterium]
MFTGIIETLATIELIEQQQSNKVFTFNSFISNQLKIDQSVAHNGVCLTVVNVRENTHQVVAIQETIDKTNLKEWKIGDLVNLERCMPANGRFDGHIVQGHVDVTAICVDIIDQQGSWKYTFKYDSEHITVEKGSICVNGTSLTVVDSQNQMFSVAIIPYTYENTVFKTMKIGDSVNLEFDILGKYIAKLMKH